jgi:protein O-mannosyl-transferase
MKKTWQSLVPDAALIVFVTLVAYMPALFCGFVWDDDDHLTANHAVQSVEGLKQIWSSLTVSRYYPLTLTSFWAQHRLWGLNPLPYHAVNIALQAANAVLLWRVLSRLKARGALLAAALWAVHPVGAETVGWVTELKNTQSGFFFLLALLFFLNSEKVVVVSPTGTGPVAPEDGDHDHRKQYALSMLCGVAAMLSKPSTIVLPAVMLFCVWWRQWQLTGRNLLRVVPLILCGIAMSLLTIVEQRWHIGTGIASDWTLTAPQRLVLAGDAVWFYASKLLWPANLSFIYPRWELPVDSVVAWLPLAGLFLVAGALWYLRGRAWARAATFGLGYFVVTLMPVLGFFDIYFFRYSFVADHFQYLASMGLIALAVSTGTTIFQRAGPQGSRLGRLAAMVVLLVAIVSTWRQVRVYQDMETLWRDVAKKNPDAWIAHDILGVVCMRTDRLPEAAAHLQRALELAPDNPEANESLADLFVHDGRVDDAIRHYNRALQARPNWPDVINNLGLALARQGKLEEAVTQFSRALELKPNAQVVESNLGLALVKLGRFDEALVHATRALELDPRDAQAHYTAAVVLEEKGQLTEAAQHYAEVVRLQPNHSEARSRLAKMQEKKGATQNASQ